MTLCHEMGSNRTSMNWFALFEGSRTIVGESRRKGFVPSVGLDDVNAFWIHSAGPTSCQTIRLSTNSAIVRVTPLTI